MVFLLEKLLLQTPERSHERWGRREGLKKYVLILLIFLCLYSHLVFADDSDLFTTQANPNVLIILDNSNSMDEDFYGNAVGSFSPQSKTVVGKKALRNIIDSLKDKLRVGLMTYNVSGVSAYYLNNNPVFVSYDPKSYCPNPPPECVKYAQTGDAGAKLICRSACRADNPSFDVDYFDEILNSYPIGTEQRTRYSNLVYPHNQRRANPTDASHFIYYKHAYPLYTLSKDSTAFFGYSSGYNPNEGEPWDSYGCYQTKTGTADDGSGYSNHSFNMTVSPTDTDIALGYKDFGKRLYWYYVGKTWFSNTSPGKGYLHVPVDNLTNISGNPTATYTNLRNKLDPKENDETGYMSCVAGDKNTCSYVVNAGLTPTAGTLQEALNYFKGVTPYTSPIEASCQKNFIIYVTDGLPSVDESGTGDTAEHLMPTVLARIDTLRKITKDITGTNYDFDVKTYVLGVGLSDEAKLKLDEMAVRGGTDVSGRAYYADDPTQLTYVLNQIFASVVESAYSFASPTVPSVRMIDKDILYLSSFTPLDKSPFWPGSLRAYQLNEDGTLPVDAAGNPVNSPLWDAGAGLKSVSPDARTIYTYARGAMMGFTRTNVSITKEDLAVATDAERDTVIDYVRGNVQDTYDLDHDGKTIEEQRPWKLGDIFHSNSVIVGSPSQFFEDTGFSGTSGFYEANKNRKKVAIAGANDGMLHAFDAATGIEQWAFIPNSLLKNLKLMQTAHTYYVDSTPKVADVWLDYNGDNKKSRDEWRTVLVSGLRKGGKTYFALDITDTLNSKYLWEFPKSTDATTLSLVGQSWSEPAIGRVKIENAGNLVERWVAFIGGGFDPDEKGGDANIGRAFFVIDIKTGEIIWQFSYDPGDAVKKWMKHSFPASPTAIDTNFDGYVDKVYIGDLGGQMWIFDVSFNEPTTKSNSLWSGKRLFTAKKEASEKHKIYYQPAVAFDKNGAPWVFFGTGDREDPKDLNSERERFYAVKDDGSVKVDGSGDHPLNEGDLADLIGSGKNDFDPVAGKGWYITLAKVPPDDPGESSAKKQLEKVLAKPAVFNRLIYFTTYTAESGDLCAVAGTSKEYVVEYLSGGGALNVDEMSDILNPPADFVYKRSQKIGIGAPSTPVITVNRKGKASVIIGTTSGRISSGEAFSLTTDREILFWREVVAP